MRLLPATSVWFILILCRVSRSVPSPENTRDVDFGLENNDVVQSLRNEFEERLVGNEENATEFEQEYTSPNNVTFIRIIMSKDKLKMFDDCGSQNITAEVEYSSQIPIHLSYDLDSTQSASLLGSRWYWLPPSNNTNFTIFLNITAKQIGLSYLRFWINEGAPWTDVTVHSWPLTASEEDRIKYESGLKLDPIELGKSVVVGFPVIVLRAQGVVQLIFRIFVVIMVSIFTFTMGCELNIDVLKSYAKRPIGPVIGFGCQFVLMPLVAFGIAKVVPIKREFGFGLLTIGCSPGGGASNAWSLMLGGDINLSIMMTFISSLSALFMMPLLLFLYGRFFIDVNRVSIPYGNIALQLLQITTPVVLGLGLRAWKPKIALRMTRLTRPMFIFFIFFFLTFGIYANLSIFSLIGTYPIVMPTSALLPWLGFALAALVAFILRQSRPVIITVALETGIQNVGAAILVLLYSMTQPAGDLGAVMPITVSIFTPIPLYFLLLGITIKRRCCTRKPTPAEVHEVEALRGKDPETNNPKLSTAKDLANGLAPSDKLIPPVLPSGDTTSV